MPASSRHHAADPIEDAGEVFEPAAMPQDGRPLDGDAGSRHLTPFGTPWVRRPVDWREDHDLSAGRQHFGLDPPGAALDDNPCAVEIRLGGDAPQAEPATDTLTGERCWQHQRWTVRRIPGAENGALTVQAQWNPAPAGTIRATAERIEFRRSDPWRTLLTWIRRTDGRPALDNDEDAGRIAAAGVLVFAAPWPAGPPRIVGSRDQDREAGGQTPAGK